MTVFNDLKLLTIKVVFTPCANMYAAVRLIVRTRSVCGVLDAFASGSRK